MQSLRLIAFIAAFGPLSAVASPQSQNESEDKASAPAHLAWTWLKGLNGAYRTEDAEGGVDTVAYQLISRGSALMETWGTPDTRVELTVFHLDGDKLVATHYCARGTQATMEANVDTEARTITFSMRSIMNLESPTSAHNSGFSYVFNNDGTVYREETWRKDGDTTVYGLTISET